MNTSQVDKGLTRFGQVLVILGEPPVLAQPCKCPLHNPALGQYLEANHIRSVPHELHQPVAHVRQTLTPEVFQPSYPGSHVSTISVDGPQPRQVPQGPLEQLPGSVSVLNTRRMHHDYQQQTHRVYKDVPLSPFDVLPSIVANRAARPPFSAVFTDWLSMIAAEGSSSLPASIRTCLRSTSLIRSNTPSSLHCAKYMYTTSQGGRS